MRILKKANLLLPALALFVADARPATAQTMLLNGTSTPTQQGWTSVGTSLPAATITNNGTYTEISTLGTTQGSGSTSGNLLYSKAVTLNSLATFQVDFSLQVVAGSGVHNPFDAPVAFGTGIDNAGTVTQRAQMIYFDPTRIGWGDDSASYLMDTTGSFHLYSLTVDSGSGIASLAVDGVTRLTRTGYAINNEVSFGDQTNDPNVNGAFRIAYINVVPEPSAGALLAGGIGMLGLVLRGWRRTA